MLLKQIIFAVHELIDGVLLFVAQCELGSYFGFGHRIELSRSVRQFLSPPTQGNYNGLQVSS